MRQVRSHDWNLTPEEAIHLQQEYATLVERTDRLPQSIRYVAGADVAYGLEGDPRVFATVVVIDMHDLKTAEIATEVGEYQSSYVPGLFAFRELPTLCLAMAKITRNVDLIICDGQGIAHPRRCGIASHLGILFDVPTIGCGKTRLLGTYSEPGPDRGDWSSLLDGGEFIGSVLRTQSGINPLFVSTGHRVSESTARDWILRLAAEYRQAEPIRRANQVANELRESHGKVQVP